MAAEYKVLITTSGVGSRLGDLTKYTNKALVRVGRKPVISYIVEAYPPDVEIVVTLGYYGSHVREFLTLTYPERTFTFVEIDNYQGPGSSLVYSMSKAEHCLQCPFIFHASDTIVLNGLSTLGDIPRPEYNWLGGYRSSNSNDYRSLSVSGDYVTRINEKGEMNYDYDYIGLASIHDYALFWKTLKAIYEEYDQDKQLSDCHVINKMGIPFKCMVFHKWLDIGNTTKLKEAQVVINEPMNVLDKPEESIFIFNDFVIKFFHDKRTVANRVKRTEFLGDTVPEILQSTDNFYKYSYAKGDLFSEVANIESFKKLLQWSFVNLWKASVSNSEFYDACLDFYRTKSVGRINKMLSVNDKMTDESVEINGLKVPGAMELLKSMDWHWLCTSYPSGFHGDFILDNIIKTENGFKLLDWRQDFGGSLEWGDIYYDLGKLNHNLTVNHDIINKNLFRIEFDAEKVICNIHVLNSLQDCKQVLHQFIIHKGFDLKKVQVITSLIWLNMAPLHHYPFNLFLYYFGRYNLYIHLNDIYDIA